MRFKSLRFLAVFSLLAAAAIWLNGCLECQESIVGRYDADSDQFVFLNIYQRIGGEKPADFDYLHALYQNRDHLLTPPFPNFFGKTSFLRLSAKTYCTLNLGSPPNSLDPQESPVPLDQIKVLPGQFFLRGPEALCYYDQIVVPGSFIDLAITAATPAWRKSLSDGAQQELDRRKGGGKALTWAALRVNLAKDIHKSADDKPAADAKPDPQADDPNSTDFVRALSEQSLQNLQNPPAGRPLGLTRTKSVFVLSLPLADADVTEGMATVQTIRDALAEELKKPDHDKEMEKGALLVGAVEARAAAGKGLEFSVDAVALFPRVQKMMDPVPELPAPADPGAALRYKNAVDAMRAKGAPISQTAAIPQILADFQARKLPANDPEHSLKPGDGIKVEKSEELEVGEFMADDPTTGHDPELGTPVNDLDHWLGPADAPVTLVEYGDYECPDCFNAEPVVAELRSRLGDRLRVVYRHFARTAIHPRSSAAAAAAEAAAAQGRFWEMHAALFKHQKELANLDLTHLALRIGLEFYRFQQAIESANVPRRVQADFDSAVRSGVTGTPTFFINGRRYRGPAAVEPMLAAIMSALESQ